MYTNTMNDESSRSAEIRRLVLLARDGDAEAERKRLRREIARAEGMLANDRFVANAPAEVVEAERSKLERYRGELALLGE